MSIDGLTVNPGQTHSANIQTITVPVVTRSDRKASENVRQDEEFLTTQKKLDSDVLAKIADKINKDFRLFNTTMSFSVDDATGNTVIKIVDRDSGKVIREIPPSELLKLAANLAEIIGRIVDESA